MQLDRRQAERIWVASVPMIRAEGTAGRTAREPRGRLAINLCRAIASYLLVLPACHSQRTDESTGSSGADGSEAAPTSSGVSWPPDECPIDASPFLSPECLAALRSACNEHTGEDACAAEPRLAFADDMYIVRCAWAKVVTFSDAAACAVASVAGRCEASVDTACRDACAGEPLISNLSAIPSELEIIELCGGPLGPWSAVGSEPGAHVGACAKSVQPPAPPLCDCAAVACSAE